MTYYEYIGIRRISKVMSPPERRQRMIELEQFFGAQHSRNLIGHERVWLNVLPIHVHKLRLEGGVG